MNFVQFKDPVSGMCFAGTVAATWSLTQEVTGSSLFTVMPDLSLSSHLGKTPVTGNFVVSCLAVVIHVV